MTLEKLYHVHHTTDEQIARRIDTLDVEAVFCQNVIESFEPVLPEADNLGYVAQLNGVLLYGCENVYAHKAHVEALVGLSRVLAQLEKADKKQRAVMTLSLEKQLEEVDTAMRLRATQIVRHAQEVAENQGYSSVALVCQTEFSDDIRAETRRQKVEYVGVG